MVGRITLGSLFDGIGGFPLCAALSGVTPLWAAEIEPACIAVTKQHFPDMLHFGDISQINGAEIPPVDIITFGSPCQDVSVAGKRAGIKHKDNGDDETTRSGLFFEAIRIIYEMRRATNGKYPTFIVQENVPGAFNSRNGNDFRTVLEEITKTDIPMPAGGKWANAGVVRGGQYAPLGDCLTLNIGGVPQRRKRIYLVGSFGSNCAEEILFKCDSVRRYLAPRGTQGQAASRDIGTGVEGCNYIFDCRGNGDGITAPTITGDHNSRVTDYSAVVLQSAGFLDRAPKDVYSIGIEWIVRRLTPLECERLQGYPDRWTVIRKIEDMTEEEYEFFKGVFLLDKKIRGKVVKNIPNKRQILKWYNKLDCDGTRYKQTGNSLAIPCALRVIGYIADYIRERVEK